MVSYGEDVIIQDVPPPVIDDSMDIIVKVSAAGVCRTDLHIISGVMNEATGNPTLPFTLGHENVGVITEIGKNVTNFQIGDEVILHPQISCGTCIPCREGDDMHCEKSRGPGLDGTDGGFAEYIKTNERSVIRLHKGTDPIEVAPLADAGVTVYHAVKKILPIAKPSTKVAVIGLGALGQIAIQLLKSLTGSVVIGLDTSDSKLRNAEKLGADSVIMAGNSDTVSQVMKETDGRGAGVVMDFVGEYDAPRTALSILGRGSTYSIIGYGGDFNLSTLQMVGMELSILGNLVGNYRDLVDLMSLYYQGKVRIPTESYPLSEAEKALRRLSNGKIMGRAVLTP